jgi:hypothetical protein
MSEIKESKAMIEVREWKAAVWQEVAHLPLDEAITKLLADSAKSAERLGFAIPKGPAKSVALVAESPAPYRTTRTRKK